MNTRTLTTAGLAAAALLALTSSPASAASPSPTQKSTAAAVTSSAWLVVPSGTTADAAVAVRRAGGSVSRVFDGIGQVAARMTAAQASALRSSGAVRAVAANAPVTYTGMAYDVNTDPGSPRLLSDSTGARAVWRTGITGKGVDVAVLDSGVSPVKGLDGAGKIVVGPDLSFDSQDPAIAGRDAYGHGTHMASIIAGRDANLADPVNPYPDQYYGIAPDARILSVKLGDRTGAVDITQVLAGIDWVVQHKQDSGLNVRVLNLSFGTDSSQSYTVDPLAYAAEIAWKKGLVVVAAAGNAGTNTNPNAPGLSDPAYDPTILAVGASDMRSTLAQGDNVIPGFSSKGANGRNPDVVAPGRSIIGARVPGSSLDVAYGALGGEVGNRFFRGSGTSQAAAVVSGGVALMLQKNPGLTPDQVKALLKSTAVPLANTPVEAGGAGEVNFLAATQRSLSGLAVPTPAYTSTGFGTLQGSRGTEVLTMDGVKLTGEQDIFGVQVNSWAMSGAEAGDGVWIGGVFNSVQWTGASWANNPTWASSTWGSVAWSGRSWSGRSWSGRSWSGRSWSGGAWAGGSWGEIAKGDGNNAWSSALWG